MALLFDRVRCVAERPPYLHPLARICYREHVLLHGKVRPPLGRTLALALLLAAPTTACRVHFPTATAQLVGNPVLVGPVTRLGGARDEPAGVGQPLELSVDHDYRSFKTPTDSDVTIRTNEREHTLSVELMEATGMDHAMVVRVGEVTAHARYWWFFVVQGGEERVGVEATLHSAGSMSGAL